MCFTVSQKMSPDLQYQTTTWFILAVAICDQNFTEFGQSKSNLCTFQIFKSFFEKTKYVTLFLELFTSIFNNALVQ